MSAIKQIEGCEFTTEELQYFHKYYQQRQCDPQLVTEERTQQFIKDNPLVSAERLQQWLQQMDTVYGRFEQYDFAGADGFNQMVAEVYKTAVDKQELKDHMLSAKVRYYNDHVEPIGLEDYLKHKQDSAPKPVCPYQHLWQQKDINPSTLGSNEFVCMVDLAQYVGDLCKLTQPMIEQLIKDLARARENSKYQLVALTNSSEGEFLPQPDCSVDHRLVVRWQMELRQTNQHKPLLIIASGSVHPYFLSILLSTPDLITTEQFSATISEDSLISLYDWAQIGEPAGKAEYVIGHPGLVIRASELNDLGFGSAFISERQWEQVQGDVWLAASCPMPDTRETVQKAYRAETQYPGPSKLSPWRREIQEYFPQTEHLEKQLRELADKDVKWACKYLKTFENAQKRQRTMERFDLLQRIRREQLEYSQALLLEYNLVADKPASSIPEIIIPDECPFAQIYRSNPTTLSVVSPH